MKTSPPCAECDDDKPLIIIIIILYYAIYGSTQIQKKLKYI